MVPALLDGHTELGQALQAGGRGNTCLCWWPSARTGKPDGVPEDRAHRPAHRGPGEAPLPAVSILSPPASPTAPGKGPLNLNTQRGNPGPHGAACLGVVTLQHNLRQSPSHTEAQCAVIVGQRGASSHPSPHGPQNLPRAQGTWPDSLCWNQLRAAGKGRKMSKQPTHVGEQSSLLGTRPRSRPLWTCSRQGTGLVTAASLS